MPVVNYTVANGEIIAENRGGVRKCYVPDPLGSTRALLDSSQNITDTFDYWPYGEVTSRTGTTATPFQFVGTAGYYQDSSSRTYVRARTLRTDLARWLTEDPGRPSRGALSAYWYGDANPATLTDSSGLQPRICNHFFGPACFACWYLYFMRHGATPSDACETASGMCRDHSIDCNNPPGPPQPPPRPTPPSGGAVGPPVVCAVVPWQGPPGFTPAECQLACGTVVRQSNPTLIAICRALCNVVKNYTCEELWAYCEGPSVPGINSKRICLALASYLCPRPGNRPIGAE